MRYIPAFFLPLLIASAPLAAQATATDVFSGRVTDPAGQPVADAQIEVVSLGSKVTRVRLTDSAGRYRIAFPENAPRYQVSAKKMGFSPVQRIVYRGSEKDERFVNDVQFTGSPVALSMVEVTGDIYRPMRPPDKPAPGEATVPNPVAEILAQKDSLHLSAVQILGLSDIADSLHSKNSSLFRQIHSLLSKQQKNGNPTEMAGTVAMMLQEATTNSDRAVLAAEKLLRPEQWSMIPKAITGRQEGQESQGAPAR